MWLCYMVSSSDCLKFARDRQMAPIHGWLSNCFKWPLHRWFCITNYVARSGYLDLHRTKKQSGNFSTCDVNHLSSTCWEILKDVFCYCQWFEPLLLPLKSFCLLDPVCYCSVFFGKPPAGWKISQLCVPHINTTTSESLPRIKAFQKILTITWSNWKSGCRPLTSLRKQETAKKKSNTNSTEKLSRQCLINRDLKKVKINFVCFGCQSVVYAEKRK